MTRSMFSYLKLDFVGALKYNLLSIILIYLIIYYFIYGNLNLKKTTAIMFLTVTIIYTIFRNIFI